MPIKKTFVTIFIVVTASIIAILTAMNSTHDAMKDAMKDAKFISAPITPATNSTPSEPTKPLPVEPVVNSAAAQSAQGAKGGQTTQSAKPIASDLAADAQIAALLQSEIKTYKLPAMAAAVVKDGRLIGSAAVGVRKMKDPTEVTIDDPFHLGTNTKALTATLIGCMVDQGKLRWESTIAETLGREIPGIHPDFAGVTVDQLLHHRSGLLARGPSEVWNAAQRAKGTASAQRALYVEAMLTAVPAKRAGEYQYSNAGYAVLGMIAETVGGKPYEQLMQEQIFMPLGIPSAGFGPAGEFEKVLAPWPHLDGAATFTDNPECISSSARVHMNIRDWAKFANFQLGHQPTPPLLKPQTLEHLQALQGVVKDDEMGYACGWFRPYRAWAGGRTLHHVGGNMVNFSEIWLAPSKDFGVMVACNEGNPESAEACEAVAAALIERFLGVAPGPLNSARDRTNPVKKPKG